MSKECVDCRFKGKGLCKNCVYGPSAFTNADRIRAMSDEELARWMTNFFWGHKKANLFDLLKWIRQPAEEE